MNKDAEAVCQETTPIQEKLDKLGKQITVLGASAAAIVFAIEVIQFVMNGQLNFMLQHFKNLLGAAPEEEATVLFTLFVLFQLFNVFNCRELDDTPMFKNLLKNKLMLGVFLLVLILQGIITQFGVAVFETVPLSVGMWGKMLLTAFTVIILNEVVKAVKRLFGRK